MRIAMVLLLSLTGRLAVATPGADAFTEDQFYLSAEILDGQETDFSDRPANQYASNQGNYSRIDAVAAVEHWHCKPESGEASWYGGGFNGQKTANGEIFDTNSVTDMTAAHRTLPMGTRVRVTNKRNGLSVIVRINNRGPFIRGRIIDVSRAAAKALRIDGVGPVQLNCL